MLTALEKIWQAVRRDDEKKTPSVSDAEFLGWQKTHTGELLALYNVKAKQHPLYLSTVSEKTLRQHHLEIPPTPLPQGQSWRFDREG